jgi:hypothetical protein
MSMLFPKQPASSGPFDLEGQLQSQASFGASQVPLPGAATAGHPGALDQVTFFEYFRFHSRVASLDILGVHEVLTVFVFTSFDLIQFKSRPDVGRC